MSPVRTTCSELMDLGRLSSSDLDASLAELDALVQGVTGADGEALGAFMEHDPGLSIRKRLCVVRRGGVAVAFTFYRLFHGHFSGLPGLIYEYTAASSEALGSRLVGAGPVLRDALGFKLVHPRARVGLCEASLQIWRLERSGRVQFPVRELVSDQTIRHQLARLGQGRLRDREAAA